MKEFKCEGCNETFESLWSDEEAMEEAVSIFGESARDAADNAVVCDTCFKACLMQFPQK